MIDKEFSLTIKKGLESGAYYLTKQVYGNCLIDANLNKPSHEDASELRQGFKPTDIDLEIVENEISMISGATSILKLRLDYSCGPVPILLRYVM